MSLSDIFRVHHVPARLRLFTPQGSGLDTETAFFLNKAFPASASGLAPLSDLPANVCEFAFGNIPIVLLPDWSASTRQFAARALKNFFPIKVMALLAGPGMSDKALDVYAAGFKSNEILVPGVVPDKAVQLIKDYAKPLLPITHIGVGRPLWQTKGIEGIAESEKVQITLDRVSARGAFADPESPVMFSNAETLADLTFDYSNACIRKTNGSPHEVVKISPANANMLQVLMLNKDREVSLYELYAALYKNSMTSARVFDVMACNLNKQLKNTFGEPYGRIIQSTWGGRVISESFLNSERDHFFLTRSRPGINTHPVDTAPGKRARNTGRAWRRILDIK